MLFCFKSSGRIWTVFQTISTSLGLVALRSMKVEGTRFQAHLLNVLCNFMRNFMNPLLLVENIDEHGSRKDSLVIKEMYPYIKGFQKKVVQI